MSADPLGSTGPLESLSPQLDKICDRFEDALKAAEGSSPQPRIEDWLAEVPEAAWPAILPELIALEVTYCRGRGEDPRPVVLCRTGLNSGRRGLPLPNSLRESSRGPAPSCM
jgi:hypothetical protein